MSLVLNFISSTNHVVISLIYFSIGMVGGIVGLTMSFLFSLELSLPGYLMSNSIQYLTFMSFHGLFMVFFMIMPILIGGFGNLLVPINLCITDLMFPRMNSLSAWLLLTSMSIMLLSTFVDAGINCGWTF